MSRRTSASAAVLMALLAAGCSAGESRSRADTASKQDQPSDTASAEQSEKADESNALRLPDHPDFLVRVRAGAGAESLPDFRPSGDVYTVHLKCSGAKSLRIVVRDDPKLDPTTVQCDSPVTVGRIYADPGRQKLAIKADDGARWTLAIVDGKYAI
ncbi:hypothetical protein ACIBKX_22365 [Streptomyces sp. NPDC050658]|uniref:hypothetical protein n=1 Tax=unclassified Streptomyces TaxID=2593676 RepID=UPI00341DF90A